MERCSTIFRDFRRRHDKPELAYELLIDTNPLQRQACLTTLPFFAREFALERPRLAGDLDGLVDPPFPSGATLNLGGKCYLIIQTSHCTAQI
jgi:hypothetical protein